MRGLPGTLLLAAAVLAWFAVVPGAVANSEPEPPVEEVVVTGTQPGPGLYVCTDARGRTHSGDRPPAECVNREIRVLNRDGSLREVIPAPLTAEQRAARAAEEQRKAEEADQLLAAWSALWHPALVAAAKAMPRWAPAESPPQEPTGYLILLPPCCEGLVPADRCGCL